MKLDCGGLATPGAQKFEGARWKKRIEKYRKKEGL